MQNMRGVVMTEDQNKKIDDLLRRARKSYRSLDGLIAISPKLIKELTDMIEELRKD